MWFGVLVLILEGRAEKGELAKRAEKDPTEGKPAEGLLQRGESRETTTGSTVHSQEVTAGLSEYREVEQETESQL